MTLDDRLENVAIIGAGGKMGSGIALLLAQEMTMQMRKSENQSRNYQLTLMDVNPDALEGVQRYITSQAIRFVEKNVDRLKENYPNLQETDALQEQFLKDLSSIIHPTSDLADVKNAGLIFEAVLEKVALKTSIFKQLKSACSEQAYFLSNTSSIPIKELDSASGLNGRIIGFHFYNPPAVQKLVELIVPEKIAPELLEQAKELGKRLRKIMIPANDVAGFIGNGHFMRDGLHAISEAKRLQDQLSFVQSLYTVNRITQEFLIRPMGIFQLVDYVGLDIFQSILQIMNPHFPEENLHSELIDTLVDKGVKGGQHPDGSQKEGFFQYDKGKPAAIYDLEAGNYVALDEGNWKTKADERIGPLPEKHAPWKVLLKDEERSARLEAYFKNLRNSNTFGAQLAKNYLKQSKVIGELLVSNRVANSIEDVNGVLMNGFFHLYGPINNYV